MSGLEGAAVLAPVAGDPGEVRRLAAGLGAQAELLVALARTLRGLGDPAVAVWESPAGEAFGRRVGAVPGVVDRVAHRYGVAAAALRSLAEALQEAQAEVARCQRLHQQEWGPFLRAGDEMAEAETSPDPARRALAGHHRIEMVAHGERVQLAVRRHAEAHDAYAVADRACAVVLRGLLDDGLADSGLYDALTGVSRVGGQLAGVFGTVALLPPARPLGAVAAAAEGVSLAADAVVLVGYGDGDPTSLALAAAATAVGAVAPVFKAGARATNVPGVIGAGTRAGRRRMRVTAADRLEVGLAATVPGFRPGLVGRRGVSTVAPPKPRPAPPWTRPPATAAALRPWLREQTTVRAAQWARARWVDDLITVLRADGASVRWHAVGLAADGTAAGLQRGSSLRERQLDAREGADLRESGERHR